MATKAASFSFVHAADLHLDTPFTGVEASAPIVASALRDASLRAFEAVIDLALERNVDFVLFAGDIYDGAERGIRAQLQFLEGLRRLDRAGIESFIVHGNHDPVESGWTAISGSFPPSVTIFPFLRSHNDRAEVATVTRDGRAIATIQGVSFKERATTENLSHAFIRPDGEATNIGLLHCNVEGSPTAHSNYSPCTVADLINTGLDYLALGHVHDRRILARHASPEEPWIVYPGNTQARSINEMGPKGAYVVTVTDGVIAEPEFVACDTIRFCRREIAIDDFAFLDDLISAFEPLEEEILRANDHRSTIARITLTGRGTLHALLAQRETLDEVQATVRARARMQHPFCWWEQIIDATSATIDLDEIRARGDFCSDLVQLTDAYADDPTQHAAIAQELSDALPRALRRDLTHLFDANDMRELIHASRQRALDEILGEP